jgi:septal ring factor EnvC (AmiA/AmiB activator)
MNVRENWYWRVPQQNTPFPSVPKQGVHLEFIKICLSWGVVTIFAFCVACISSNAQSRVNTKKLSDKLKQEGEKQLSEADREIQKAQNAIKESDKKLAAIQKDKARLNAEIKKTFETMIQKIVTYPQARPILKKNPQAIRTIPQIEKALIQHPHLSSFLDDLLNEHFKSS